MRAWMKFKQSYCVRNYPTSMNGMSCAARTLHLYNQLLKDTPVITPVECPENLPVYHLYVIRVPKRDELQAWLKSQGIFTGIHYPVPNHLQPALGSLRL
jgi:dTDP-4-amino-4,6-dideoxygalactose transaminase